MSSRAVARFAVVLAVAQMLLAAAFWYLLTDSQLAGGTQRVVVSTAATQRLAELYANAAFRSVITSDYAALNELIRQSSTWQEVVYVSVEDAQGRVLAHTDATKVGRTWNDRLAAEVRTTVKVPYEEVTAPLVDPAAAAGKTGGRAGQLRLGYIVDAEIPATSSPRNGHLSLAIVLALAVVASIPVAMVVARVAEALSLADEPLPADPPLTGKDEKLATTLRDQQAEAQRLRNELGQRNQELTKMRGERDRSVAEAEELRSSAARYAAELGKLRADAARLEAELGNSQPEELTRLRERLEAEEGQTLHLRADIAALRRSLDESAPRTSVNEGGQPDGSLELKQLHARTVMHIAQAFRTSLTNVLGYSKLLLRGADGKLNEGQRTNVANIQEAGARLEGLVNALLEYVRVETGASEATPEVVDVASLLREVAAASGVGSRLEISAGSGDDAALAHADRGQLEQILRVLLTDVSAGDAGGKAAVAVRPPGPDGALVIELAFSELDATPGQVRDLLDPFASDDFSRPLDEGRLRLALARCLAEANGGHLRLELREGVGPAFVLEIPAASASLTA